VLFNFSLIVEGATLFFIDREGSYFFSLIGEGTILFFIDIGGHYLIFH